MTNDVIFDTALRQSAIDLNCERDDFLLNTNQVVTSTKNKDARRYLELPFACNLVSYGNNVVASVDSAIISVVKKHIDNFPVVECLDAPNLMRLNQALGKYNIAIASTSEYFLPDLKQLKEYSCPYKLKVIDQIGLENLYFPQWTNALCEQRKALDVLCVGAYDNNILVGLAGASADCATMWQIGVDVLPEYRGCGIGSALTSRLALEIITRGKVPFYCAVWSNIKSIRNALRSGFYPAWIEITAKAYNTNI